MKISKLLGGLAALILAVALIAICDPPQKAKADTQVMQTGFLLPYTGDFLNGNMVQVPLNSSTNLTAGVNSGIVAVHPGAGLAIWPVFICTNTNAASMASNITITLATSPWTNSSNPEVAATPVGTTLFTTNFTTALTSVVTGSGTNLVMGYAWFPWTNIAGRRITVAAISTTFTNVGGINVSNIFWQQFAPQ